MQVFIRLLSAPVIFGDKQKLNVALIVLIIMNNIFCSIQKNSLELIFTEPYITWK